ncbi:MAG: SAM-dependent methyltransferase [Stanieria sp.]
MNNQAHPNSYALQNIICDRIAASLQQRITFAEFMDVVLYHPQYGYYRSGVVEIGSKGDFFTASSLGKDFGELLAIQFVEMWGKMGFPAAFFLVEVGAGNGNLALDILSYLQNNEQDFFQALEYIIIEESPALKKQQQELLQEFKLKIKWRSLQNISDNALVGCVFSNELIDAFPVHQVIINQGKLQEVYLTNLQNQITEVYEELSTPKLLEYFQLVKLNFPSEDYPEGYRTEVNLAALDWLQTVANKLQQGYLLTIDYGYPAHKYYHPQRSQGTLQCYYQHRRHNNPYLNLGYQDLTTHVDFTALEVEGNKSGLTKIGFTQQGMFLMALGLGDRLSELYDGNYNALEVIQRRDALHQLINPSGLGGFGVLLQAKGLTIDKPLLKGFSIPSLA